jgi:uncharacterized repeat protein (TIGR03803 family)
MSKPKSLRPIILLCSLSVATGMIGAGKKFTNLLIFNRGNGAYPLYGNLVQGFDGNFYGTTTEGGTTGNGIVFKITPVGTLTTVYNFCSQFNCADGYYPTAGLTETTDGTFYGTTLDGGSRGGGTVFKVTPSGALTTLYAFCSLPNCVDGKNPYAGLTWATDGAF